MLNIRLVTESDLECLIDLKWAMNQAEFDDTPASAAAKPILDLSRDAASAGVAAYYKHIADDGGEYFLATWNGAPAGSILWAHMRASAAFQKAFSHWAIIMGVSVFPAFRGKGIAKALLDHAHDRAKQHGCTHAFLEVTANNRRAQAVYGAAGYTPLEWSMLKPLT